MNKIYFILLPFFFCLCIFCVFILDTSDPTFALLCPLLTTIFWFFSLYFLKNIVSYEEREETDDQIKNLVEFASGFMTTINGMIAVFSVALLLGFDFSFWNLFFSFVISAHISFYVCSCTAIPLISNKGYYIINKNTSRKITLGDNIKSAYNIE